MDREQRRAGEGSAGRARDLAVRRLQREAPERGPSPKFRVVHGRRSSSRVRSDRHRFGRRGPRLLKANGAPGGKVGHDLGAPSGRRLPQRGLRAFQGSAAERQGCFADPESLVPRDRRHGRDRGGFPENHGAPPRKTSGDRTRRRPSRNRGHRRPRVPGPGEADRAQHRRSQRADPQIQKLRAGHGQPTVRPGWDPGPRRGAVHHQRKSVQSR
mmetsp:Transcript_25541/g.59861  ORF Transcript_25541/g.59861 Transcript_25541/m.59861 type:complete len:213 (+) Transcript_25541:244-882(+)